jgi:hypothetical protein
MKSTYERKRGTVKRFTDQSKRRFEFIVRQPAIPLVSMWTGTYHFNAPKNGKILKKHINALLTLVKKHYPGIGYLWVIEFQEATRHPHIHLLLTTSATQEIRFFLADAWNRIIKESGTHLSHHRKPAALKEWEMGDGGYLLKKHFSKKKQHIVPEGFSDVGRFWGNSRNIKPVSLVVSIESIRNISYLQQKESWKFILRTVRRYQETKVRQYGHKFKSGTLRGHASWVKDGSMIALRIVQYLKKQFPVQAALNYANLALSYLPIPISA